MAACEQYAAWDIPPLSGTSCNLTAVSTTVRATRRVAAPRAKAAGIVLDGIVAATRRSFACDVRTPDARALFATTRMRLCWCLYQCIFVCTVHNIHQQFHASPTTPALPAHCCAACIAAALSDPHHCYTGPAVQADRTPD
eukprot:IDg17529t1